MITDPFDWERSKFSIQLVDFLKMLLCCRVGDRDRATRTNDWITANYGDKPEESVQVLHDWHWWLNGEWCAMCMLTPVGVCQSSRQLRGDAPLCIYLFPCKWSTVALGVLTSSPADNKNTTSQSDSNTQVTCWQSQHPHITVSRWRAPK